MPKVLVTAFEPYDRWKTNSSWLTVVELTRTFPSRPPITTRLYPVDFSTVRQRLQEDLSGNYDVALHLGQAPGSSRIQLEAVGLNIGGSGSQSPDEFRSLVDDGPVAYRSELPLADLARSLRHAGIPAQVSYHAGTYLCNAALYLSHHIAAGQGLKTKSAFIHLPLETSQVLGDRQDLPSLPVQMLATAVRLILERLSDGDLVQA